jgi:hypothetical protein
MTLKILNIKNITINTVLLPVYSDISQYKIFKGQFFLKSKLKDCDMSS